MVPVVENLAVVPEADVQAIAAYVGEMTQQARPAGAKGSATAGAPTRTAALGSADSLLSPPAVAGHARSNLGALIYAGACANCHESGRPLPFGGLDLSLSSAMTGPTPHNVVNVTLYGLPASPGEPSAVMPGFHASLTDGQLEALLIYVRSRFSDKPSWREIRPIIRGARNANTRPALYPVPGLQSTPANPSQTGVAW
jgi:mono/diheme cytochrome c family protein